MAEPKNDIVGNCAGAVVMLALLLAFGGWAVRSVGQAVGDTLNPKAAAERRLEERTARLAVVERNEKAERERVEAAVAAERKSDEERRQRAEARRQKEEACRAQLGYDACREIYRPTDQEIDNQLRLVDRANQLARP
jgi:hypothetical protein